MTAMTEAHDRIINSIFNQLDLLKDMAGSIGDTALQADLDAVLNRALDRYCETKRNALAIALKTPVPQFARKCA